MFSKEKEIEFVIGKFLDITLKDIEPSRLYLFKYFDRDAAKAFVKYYEAFEKDDWLEGYNRPGRPGPNQDIGTMEERFRNRTGYVTVDRSIRRYIRRYNILEEAYKKAKEECDSEMIALIRSGNFKVE